MRAGRQVHAAQGMVGGQDWRRLPVYRRHPAGERLVGQDQHAGRRAGLGNIYRFRRIARNGHAVAGRSGWAGRYGLIGEQRRGQQRCAGAVEVGPTQRVEPLHRVGGHGHAVGEPGARQHLPVLIKVPLVAAARRDRHEPGPARID